MFILLLPYFFVLFHLHKVKKNWKRWKRKCHFSWCLSFILESLHSGETIPEVYRCLDGYYHRVIWGIGPYLGDYPEQVLLSCIVQGWCAWWVSILHIANLLLVYMILYSYQGDKEDLDGPLSELQRTCYLTETLVAKYRVGTLWDKFGIVSDIVVSIFISL